jgi:hypothetical protein
LEGWITWPNYVDADTDRNVTKGRAVSRLLKYGLLFAAATLGTVFVVKVLGRKKIRNTPTEFPHSSRTDTFTVRNLPTNRFSASLPNLSLSRNTDKKQFLTTRRCAERGKELGELVEEKNAAYGDAGLIVANCMKALYPNGIPFDKIPDALYTVRVLYKLCWIANRKDAFGENPWQDIGGYGILVSVNDERLSEAKSPF